MSRLSRVLASVFFLGFCVIVFAIVRLNDARSRANEKISSLEKARAEEREAMLAEQKRVNREFTKSENWRRDLFRSCRGCVAHLDIDYSTIEFDPINLKITEERHYGIATAFSFYGRDGMPRLVTAAHAAVAGDISGMDKINHLYLAFANSKPQEVELVGWCEPLDIASLRFKTPPGSYGEPVMLGNSGALDEGSDLMAIGSLLGNKFTATYGWLANPAIPKTHPRLTPYILTHFEYSSSYLLAYSGRLDHGCSGGPIFSKNGQIVGMGLQIIKGRDAMPLALTSEDIAAVYERLDKPGKLEVGFIGAVFSDSAKLIPPDNDILGIPQPAMEGVIVVTVQENGPADGLLAKGDIITNYNGVPVKKARDLSRMILHTGSPGIKVSLGVVRGNGPPTVVEIVMAKLE